MLRHVSKQGEGEPLEQIGDLHVAKPDGGESDSDTQEDDEVMRVKSGKHLSGVGHTGEISTDVDRVGDQQRERYYPNEPGRELIPQRATQSLAGAHSDARAHHLHRRHEWPSDKCRPQQRSSLLRAGNGICGYAGRIIVRRAGG